jgi:hypothetical protein
MVIAFFLHWLRGDGDALASPALPDRFRLFQRDDSNQTGALSFLTGKGGLPKIIIGNDFATAICIGFGDRSWHFLRAMSTTGRRPARAGCRLRRFPFCEII